MRSRDIPFDEWRQEQLKKAPARGGIQSPVSAGLGMMGPGNTNSRAPAGPPSRRSGNPNIPAPYQDQTYLSPGSKYTGERSVQPDPWIDDVDMGTNWYSPFQPVWPFGPPTLTRPRDWDYPVGYNLQYIQPRMDLMQMLRSMSKSWGVLATIQATRQDQLLRIPWTIQRRDKPRASNPAVDEMRRFFKRPDGKFSYSQWTRLVTNDLLVLDAPCIYFSRDRKGRPLTAERLDPITVFPLIDDAGRRPDSVVEVNEDGLTYLRRQPAFQQIIKGLPMLDLDESELMYVPMRPNPEMPMFGYPPTEQILIEASEAILKTIYQRNFWKDGTIPDLIVSVPEQWQPRQIAMFQAHFDAMLSGNLNLKSKVRFLPGGMKPFDIKNSSGESLWSQRDETLIRLACYAYSVSPAPFIKMLNRATAQSSQQVAEAEGLYPLMCVDAATETLTERGWLLYDEINDTDRIASVNPNTWKIEYNLPNKKFVYNVEAETLVHFRTQSVDFLSTSNHDMWARSKNAHRFSKQKASEVDYAQYMFKAACERSDYPDKEEFTIPGLLGRRINVTESKTVSMDSWLEFLGYVISDGAATQSGNLFTLNQSLSKTGPRFLDSYLSEADPESDYSDEGSRRFSANHLDFDRVLKELGYSGTHRIIEPGGDNNYAKHAIKSWTVNDARVGTWLAQNIGVGSVNLRIPREFFQLSIRQLRILLCALMRGDGRWDDRAGCDSGSYFTISRGLADDVQELATLLGFCASLTINSLYENRNGTQTCYRVDISTRKEHNLSRGTPNTPRSRKEEVYSGVVYCFEVPNHLFVTRRNGKVAFHGNSFWKDDIIDPIIQERFGYEDVEFVFLPRPEPDAEKQAKIHQIQVREGIRPRNEIRDELGLEPVKGGDAIMIELGNIIVPLESAARGDAAQAGPSSQAPPPGNQARSRGAADSSQPSGNPQRGAARSESASILPKPSAIHKASKAQVRAAAREATGDIGAYSDAVLEIGNYKKGHVWIQGLNISIENKKGSKRGKKDQPRKMPAPYGYIRGTTGADGMQVDVFLGKYPDSDLVWVIDQDNVDKDGESKGFDEHKVMLGYKKLRLALRDWLKSHPEENGHAKFKSMTELSVDALKQWLAEGDLKEPIEDQGIGETVLHQKDLKKSLDTISTSTNLSSYDQGQKKKTKKRLARGSRWLQLQTSF